jgi:CDP-diacylglycerol---serine O-phosphatidyltransferase
VNDPSREPDRAHPLRAVPPHASDDGEEAHGPTRRGIYLLPNLITTGALFAGFYSIVAAMNDNVITAALAIYAAVLMDTADGRVARLTRTQSAFGAEYDSLSDMVAFGVAPALVAFTWALSHLGQFGWVVTFLYMACTALRLARFNTAGDVSSFTGLASPSAACLVVTAIWVLEDGRTSGQFAGIVDAYAGTVAAVTAIAALLMVSNFRYFSPKMLTLRGRVPFVALVAVVLGFALVLLDPPRVLLALVLIYAASGPVQWVTGLRKRRAAGGADGDGAR